MGGDELINFEEQKFDELVEGFIKKYRNEWESYCYEMFEDACSEFEVIEHEYDTLEERDMDKPGEMQTTQD